MKQSYIILTVALVALIAIVSTYGVYNILSSPSSPTYASTPPASVSTPNPTAGLSPAPQPTVSVSPNDPVRPSTTTSLPTSVTVTDYTGANVTVPYPVNRIVVLSGTYAEVIYAMGAKDKIVATLGSVPFVSFPDAVVIGPSSSAIPGSLETIFDLNPDLVLSDSGFISSFESTFEKIKSAGIPLYLDACGIPERIVPIVSNMGAILGNTTMANTINNNTLFYGNLVDQRLQNIPLSDRTAFYYEWGHAWYSVAGASQANTFIVSCGGLNIVTDNTVSFPTLSPEFVAESNPDVIIQQVPVIGNNLADYQDARTELMSRDILKDTKAVQDGRVYIYNPNLRTGLEYPIGKLYLAKWFYPDLFADIDPNAVFVQLIQQYFGITPEGVYFYPK